MSGPCTDCGGPDYQTLEARIAELEVAARTSLCIFCGATMEKDLAVMLDHAKGCELRPENRLMLQIAELEAERRRQVDVICCLHGEVEQAEAERDAKASAYTNTLKCLGRQAETISEMEAQYSDVCAGYENELALRLEAEAELARLQSYLAQGKGLARIRCADYYGCAGCPAIEKCEAFAEVDG